MTPLIAVGAALAAIIQGCTGKQQDKPETMPQKKPIDTYVPPEKPDKWLRFYGSKI